MFGVMLMSFECHEELHTVLCPWLSVSVAEIESHGMIVCHHRSNMISSYIKSHELCNSQCVTTTFNQGSLVTGLQLGPRVLIDVGQSTNMHSTFPQDAPMVDVDYISVPHQHSQSCCSLVWHTIDSVGSMITTDWMVSQLVMYISSQIHKSPTCTRNERA